METCPSCMFLEYVQNSQSRNFKKGNLQFVLFSYSDSKQLSVIIGTVYKQSARTGYKTTWIKKIKMVLSIIK